MDRVALEALALRCEQAAGPDRELDAAIATTIGVVPEFYIRAQVHGITMTYWWHESDTKAAYYSPPAYTASLDAAMTMVPDGDSFTIGQNVHHKHWVASVNYLGDDGAPHARSNSYSNFSAALALTAAALRAAASLAREPGEGETPTAQDAGEGVA